MKAQTLLCLCGLSLVPLLLSIEARSLASIREKSDVAGQVTGRTGGMLSRFEPLISNMVVPFLVATGVVSLVRMVPSVVSQIPNVFGFAKRHGYTELPREVLEIMQMLDGANIKYDVQPQHHAYHTTNQRYPLYHQQQIYKAAAAAASSSTKPQSQQG
ncbi:uncharacterized protein LOC144123211 isoform X2 [Amblyomma americanum]